ncbi:DeoR/GlpR family DNA-binding transcription regulator [Sporolactobacillus sp. CQH2019]|uniref:DeoR/GlpR family DNA-binding transcription regulator n=1 Tax=Sporolactobacillus sp. CQH2019 TaxID=3023512 RepID=UPI002367A435|nr:DeoR/GlpR family DNA-binding transcription regulator [Sporolactobacillus sp. CQH2019]MDD9147470.1 DeoR/GlpR family DNA-binding transcription regulator [Sporolactobacillus sp. CQH2019]
MKRTRQDCILSLLADSKNKSMSTIELANRLKVAPMTIRRDLNELAKKKMLSRTYGGASLIVERSTEEKNKIQHKAKLEIGREIANLIPERSTVYLGAGTTIFAAAQFLSLNKGIQYVTNSDLIFRYLIKKNNNVILAGGYYNKSSNQLLGTLAVQCLENYYFDISFVGTNGIFKGQATTSSFDDANIKKVALQHAKKKYIVVDSSKIGKADPYLFSDIENADGVIVDSKIKTSSQDQIKRYTDLIISKPIDFKKLNRS